jgi:hypothetical protein
MKPATLRVLKALEAAVGNRMTTHELMQPEVGGERFGARIQELRDAGYTISTKRGQGGASYKLIGRPGWPTLQPAPEQPRDDAAEPLGPRVWSSKTFCIVCFAAPPAGALPDRCVSCGEGLYGTLHFHAPADEQQQLPEAA